ncbi:MAG TPA: hypothetical protein DIT25_03320 [Candidatus Moranbacteria bacterium]|nr:hypothetical protein [Candidatus Moranbacteria bacterium]
MPGKVKYHQLSENEKKKYLGEFYSMVSLLKSREEVKNFFKDLLTLSEIVMISRRIQIAKMLLGGMTHDEIRRRLKVGFTTIAQVERWLSSGFGGYKNIIEKYNDKYAKGESDPEDRVPFSSGWMRKKYPAHYLLVNMLLGKKKK